MRQLAIYSRYSSDMQNPRSCDDQVRDCLALLVKKDIDANNPLIFADRAISGSNDERPEFKKLMAMIEGQEIAILIVDDQSRLSRGTNAHALIKHIVFHGCRFISGDGIDTAERGWAMRCKVGELQNTMFLEKLADGVRRGQRGRVMEDLSAGDLCFGYDSCYVDPARAAAYDGRGPKPAKRVVINETEAEVVRWIFAQFVSDVRSLNEIARELTRRNTPKGRRASITKWTHNDVRNRLTNRKYIGRWMWGRTRTLHDGAKSKQVPQDEADVVVRERPSLRIVSDELWNKAQTKLTKLKEQFEPRANHKPRGMRPHHSEVYPQSLLAGLVFCGACGSRMWQQGTGAKKHFVCSNGRNSGVTCSMRTQVRIQVAEKRLLEVLSEILTVWPDWMRVTLDAMRDTIHRHNETIPTELCRVRLDRETLEQKVQRLTNDIVEHGIQSPSLKQRLEGMEADLERLIQEERELGTIGKANLVMPSDDWVREKLRDLVELMKADTRRSAILLRGVIGKITAHAVIPPGKTRGYTELRFKIHGKSILDVLLADRIPNGVKSLLVVPEQDSTSLEFKLTLGAPSKMDVWGPKIYEMRHRETPVIWPEIWKITGLGSGPAYVAYKRYRDSLGNESHQNRCRS